jgi:hypothetical protein
MLLAETVPDTEVTYDMFLRALFNKTGVRITDFSLRNYMLLPQ